MASASDRADGEPVQKRKLIEVALPLEAINRESAREKSIRHGHPSTLHLWWARRPLAACRAVLFAQLVDDPSSHPDRFPTEAAQKTERERLHKLIERLVIWENVRDEKLLAEAHQEILKSTDGNPPPILDPFCGGGSIPLEAQRLGLEAHASDLNPVAVLITKALIEIPPKFRDQPPIFPGLAQTRLEWKGAEGLAADVRAYGQWMRHEAEKRIGHLYPKAKLTDGSEAAVVAWIWARTITCPNPACGVEMPLVRSWWLGKTKGKEAYIVPTLVADPNHPSGKRVEFSIGNDSTGPEREGTVGRDGAVCVACNTGVPFAYIRAQGQASLIGQTLIAVAAEGIRRRIYLPPTDEHRDAARVGLPTDLPTGNLPEQALGFRVQAYGLAEWADLFTNRQLQALTAFSDLVPEARACVLADAELVGLPDGRRLEAGGKAGLAYADAVATYLGIGLSRMADIANSLCRWENTKEQVRNLFARQTISMLWDFAEAPPFGKAAGAYEVSLGSLIRAIIDARGPSGLVAQADAAKCEYQGVALSTDPPYYDNIGYADLSDFFYVWLRRSLRPIFPQLLATLLVPKSGELVANPYRHSGPLGAKRFFETGFSSVFERARMNTSSDIPVTVYYAFKQSDADGSSSGWETLLEGMVRTGWSITATWPMRSELGNRIRSQGSNALASSIVLTLHPRPEGAPTTDRRGLIAALHAELPQALRHLQHGTIAPVDLPQAAIGPGMAVFSRYSSVIESDGSLMSVRSALARINEILDQVLNEQEGDFDATTRFAIAWYRQHGYGVGKFGDADNLARARNTSVETMDRDGILTSRAGKVALIKPANLADDYDVLRDLHTSIWEALHYLIKIVDTRGILAAGEFLTAASSRDDGSIEADLVKELAFLMFSIAENNGWTTDALSFNALATSWPEIVDASRSTAPTTQAGFDFAPEE
jgi:putative DNA methylase